MEVDIPGVPNAEACMSRCEVERFIARGNVFKPATRARVKKLPPRDRGKWLPILENQVSDARRGGWTRILRRDHDTVLSYCGRHRA